MCASCLSPCLASSMPGIFSQPQQRSAGQHVASSLSSWPLASQRNSAIMAG